MIIIENKIFNIEFKRFTQLKEGNVITVEYKVQSVLDLIISQLSNTPPQEFMTDNKFDMVKMKRKLDFTDYILSIKDNKTIELTEEQYIDFMIAEENVIPAILSKELYEFKLFMQQTRKIVSDGQRIESLNNI